ESAIVLLNYISDRCGRRSKMRPSLAMDFIIRPTSVTPAPIDFSRRCLRIHMLAGIGPYCRYTSAGAGQPALPGPLGSQSSALDAFVIGTQSGRQTSIFAWVNAIRCDAAGDQATGHS